MLKTNKLFIVQSRCVFAFSPSLKDFQIGIAEPAKNKFVEHALKFLKIANV